jgi:uncharacterized FAD-dependent dehydrogenase
MITTIELAITPAEAQNWDLVQRLALDRIDKNMQARVKAVILRRRTVDARPRVPLMRLWVEVFIDEMPPTDEKIIEKIALENSPSLQKTRKTAIIIGAGPAGYFAALELLELGIRPIILERGKDVQARRRDLKAIQQDGIVNPHSNYCFGEGGAGTYSDGKLYTRSHKRGSIAKVLQLLVEHGATSDILVDAHPHIGSNKLPNVVQNLRETILKYGGEVHFDTFVTDFLLRNTAERGREIIGVVAGEKTYMADAVILATGHSARDIFELLQKNKIAIEAKPFALGVRIEHPQALIDEIQYHQSPRDSNLPASSYSLVCQVSERGVFSFCMCPGGLIVPSATAPKELVVNGMSLSRRDSAFANSGLVVAVELADMSPNPYLKKSPSQDPIANPLLGLQFQSAVEQHFFDAGDGSQKAPAQRITDFVKGKLSATLPTTSYIPGIYAARIDQLLPAFISQRLQTALREFGKQKQGYFTEEAQLIGVESRTSSPVRVPREAQTLMHTELRALFPCGEGAGYAGGIVSAAMDGQRVATAVAQFLGFE